MQHKSREKCILDSPDIGIISENDHKVGLCLCWQCNCGKHTCASKLLFNSQQLKQKSIYISDFTKMPILNKSHNTQTNSPTPNKKFDGISTYKLDYIKHDSTPNPRFSDFIIKPPLNGFLRSSYNKDFIPFGSFRQESLSPIHSRLEKSLKFEGTSTYKNNFSTPEPKFPAKSCEKISKKIFIDPNKYLESSHKRDFKKVKASEISKKFNHDELMSNPQGITGVSSNHRDFVSPAVTIKNVPRRLTAIREFVINKR